MRCTPTDRCPAKTDLHGKFPQNDPSTSRTQQHPAQRAWLDVGKNQQGVGVEGEEAQEL